MGTHKQQKCPIVCHACSKQMLVDPSNSSCEQHRQQLAAPAVSGNGTKAVRLPADIFHSDLIEQVPRSGDSGLSVEPVTVAAKETHGDTASLLQPSASPEIRQLMADVIRQKKEAESSREG